MSYPELADVRRTLRISWYRCPVETPLLHALLKRSNAQGALQAGGHLCLWLMSAALSYGLWHQQHWLLLIPALLAHGVISSFFSGVAPHELGHGTVFRTPWLNKLFLYLFSLISWWDPFDYASSHTYHHRFTLHSHGDRENLLPLAPSTSRGLMLQLCTINLFTQPGRTFGKGGVFSTVAATARSAVGRHGSMSIPSNEWLLALHADQPRQFRKSIWWSRLLLAVHGAVLVFALATGQWIVLFIVSLSSFMANLPAYLVGMTQHCGLRTDVPDFRKCTRSITLNPLLEFLYWRMNWHIEHHMFAGVPCYNLKKLHHLVHADMPRPRTLREAWQEMSQVWEEQTSNPDHAFDTPLPPASQESATAPPDPLNAHTSIGELAPSGLKELS